ncbi:MAG: hypothetical protein MUC63_07225 [Planctomycetes bacterium]|nr:hypothetical protein [Planctomycetota bacterium]
MNGDPRPDSPDPAPVDPREAILVVRKPGRPLTGALSDLLVEACVVAGLKESGPERAVVWAVADELLPWGKLFGDADFLARTSEVRPEEFGKAVHPDAGFPEDERSRPDQTRHALRALAGGSPPAQPVFLLAEADESWASEQKARWLAEPGTPAGAPFVLLCPGFLHGPLAWPLHRWIDLEDQLREGGARTAVLDLVGAAGDPAPFRSPRLAGLPPGRAAALTRLADLVIGDDSAGLHLAGLLQRPGLALCGCTRGPQVFGNYQVVRVVQTDLPCGGCLTDPKRGWRRACAFGCEAMGAITPKAVVTVAAGIVQGLV